ncbi:hypothetical protein HK097_004473 [Rhizophlyctis rosea]|uniref:Uncharacterized protein n=1 Tax=Rhizophlyctis rosea TaxID=64517 RepID=A0AAD5S2E9_9FUNG|nr:hypothetical protein HK097_004473 [Rhizophlyctis rosea]
MDSTETTPQIDQSTLQSLFQSAIKQELDAFRHSVKSDLDTFRQDIKSELDLIRTDISGIRKEIKEAVPISTAALQPLTSAIKQMIVSLHKGGGIGAQGLSKLFVETKKKTEFSDFTVLKDLE